MIKDDGLRENEIVCPTNHSLSQYLYINICAVNMVVDNFFNNKFEMSI